MGPNSINASRSAATMGPMPASTPAAQAASTTGGLKINYGDPVKAERLQAGLRALQAAQARTEGFIRTINPELGML